jgi:beta-galactosidase
MPQDGEERREQLEERAMRKPTRKPVLTTCLLAILLWSAQAPGRAQERASAVLPAGVRAVWDLARANRDTTPTQERICINGLWRFQPAEKDFDTVPGDGWGYFKVPGPWPAPPKRPYANGGESQELYRAPAWQDLDMRTVAAAWYQREVAIPPEWTGRSVLLQANYVESYARVFLDGKPAGDIPWPGGELDITGAARPGQTQVVSILVAVKPRTADVQKFLGQEAITPGQTTYRGLVGDVFLASRPAGPHVDDVKVDTSVRQWQIALDVAVAGLGEGQQAKLVGHVYDGDAEVKRLESPVFTQADLVEGRTKFAASWQPEKLWDLNTPENQYTVTVELADATGKVLDTFRPVRFGFREFWVDGREFRLNGSRIWSMIVVADSVVGPTVAATYEESKRTFRRMKAAGMNTIYGHNYGCGVGTNLAYEEILRAADDVGMLVAYTLPGNGDYGWTQAMRDKSPEKTSGYSADVERFIREAQNHPSVVIYSLHDGGGSTQDQNPDWVDDRAGGAGWREIQAETAIHAFDETRPVYHHAGSGEGLQMYTLNNYLDFAPAQERSDWWEHWSTTGSVPLVLVEYGYPLDHNWLNYKEGYVLFGSPMLHELMTAEYGAEFRGDRAYEISEAEKEDMRLESKQWESQKTFHFSLYKDLFSGQMPNIRDVQGQYLAMNWPAFRTWGVTGITAWVLARHWNPVQEEAPERIVLGVDWDALQKPGYSIDFVEPRAWRWDLYGNDAHWAPDAAAKAIVRYSRPAMVWLAGNAEHFTEQGHNVLAGQSFEKQAILINNSREAVTADCTWRLGLPTPAEVRTTINAATGEIVKAPARFQIPAGTVPGRYELKLTAELGNGDVQEDQMMIDVVDAGPPVQIAGKVALYDPAGETESMLAGMGVKFEKVDAGTSLAGYDVLVIGKKALDAYGPGPDVTRVKDGLKVIVFEQTKETLEKRFGFRVQEHVLRQAWTRLPDHPALAGLTSETLSNWQGDGTTVGPRIEMGYIGPRMWMTQQWAGFDQRRVWHVGCRGSVASLLPEKPACGDWLPIVDGGFSLEYSPLLEYRDGKGMVLFCQMDVTGRTEQDPAAQRLAGNLLKYASGWTPIPERGIVYAGEGGGKSHLEKAGLPVADYTGGPLRDNQILVIGAGGAKALANSAGEIQQWLRNGGKVLMLGAGPEDVDALGLKVTMKTAEHIASSFAPAMTGTALAGVSPAEVYARDAKEIGLVADGAEAVGDGALGRLPVGKGEVVFCQMVPWRYDYKAFNGSAWHIYYRMHHVKWTFQRTSFLVSRLLGNLGVRAQTPMLARIAKGSEKGDSLQDLVDAPWLVQGEVTVSGRRQQLPEGAPEIVLSTHWKGSAIRRRTTPPEGWNEAGFDDSDWRDVRLPGTWDQEFPDFAGATGNELLHRQTFNVPAALAGKEMTLLLGPLREQDTTYVNGTEVGSGSGPRQVRIYKVPAGLLKEGENLIAIHVTAWSGRAGMEPMPQESVLERQQLDRLEHVGDYLPLESVRYARGLYLDVAYPYDDPYRYWRW